MAADFQDVPRIAMQVTRGIIIASVQTDLTVSVLARFQDELLSLIHRVGACGVVFDLSGVDVLDSVEFHGLRKTLKLVDLMGARPVISGLKPGIVSSLIDTNADTNGVEATFQTDDAIALIRNGQEESIVIEVDMDVADSEVETQFDGYSDDNEEMTEAGETGDPHPYTRST